MNDRTKKMLPALLVGLAGMVEIVVALTTLSQTSAGIGVGLVIGAFALFMQARKA